MVVTHIDRDLRNEVLDFLHEVANKADNLETRRKAFVLITQVTPKRARKTREEYAPKKVVEQI